MNRLRVLAIAPSFPPVLSPQSIRLALLMSSLQRTHTVEWDVVCARAETTTQLTFDSQLLLLDPGVRIHRTISIESRVLRWLGKRYFPFSLLSIPDPRIGWLPGSLWKANQLLETEHFDLICSFSNPPTSHLVALLARRRKGLPWLAFLSDPWTRMPLSHMDPVKESFNRKLERRVFEEADRLVFTWSHGLDWALGDYPERMRIKAEVLPHSFDPDLYTLGKIPFGLEKDPKKMRFVYAGIFYGSRTPEPLLNALSIIRQRSMSDLRFADFLLLGSRSRDVERQIRDFGLSDIVRATAKVPYLDSLSVMGSADVVVIIDAPMDTSPFLPSKLIDYFGTKRPILGITPTVGPTAEILQTCGVPFFHPLSHDCIAEAVLQMADAWMQGRMEKWVPSPDSVSQFGVDKVSGKLLDIFAMLGAL